MHCTFISDSMGCNCSAMAVNISIRSSNVTESGECCPRLVKIWNHSFIHTKLCIAALFIVYAPKNGTATYTNYSDVCFSQTGPRSAQIILTHILPWNLLLVISANGTEVGVLGTTETGDNPLWKQYLMLDEARAELPLTPNQIEMFPLGIDVDTGTTHHLVIDENQLPVMAMLHMLSTHGILISFNVLNMTANCPTISSPPQLVPDSSGINSFTIALPPTNVSTVTPPKNDISFNFPAAVTSTPRVNFPGSNNYFRILIEHFSGSPKNDFNFQPK